MIRQKPLVHTRIGHLPVQPSTQSLVSVLARPESPVHALSWPQPTVILPASLDHSHLCDCPSLLNACSCLPSPMAACFSPHSPIAAFRCLFFAHPEPFIPVTLDQSSLFLSFYTAWSCSLSPTACTCSPSPTAWSCPPLPTATCVCPPSPTEHVPVLYSLHPPAVCYQLPTNSYLPQAHCNSTAPSRI